MMRIHGTRDAGEGDHQVTISDLRLTLFCDYCKQGADYTFPDEKTAEIWIAANGWTVLPGMADSPNTGRHLCGICSMPNGRAYHPEAVLAGRTILVLGS